ncbi:GntR family transcriptional regulator (plasmid) [Kitasatospora griseola]|uniref:GntR family transcriptional regulator n=1 Tax=Kitasatospora griseola TaxID=2064 RepID=UPI0038558653
MSRPDNRPPYARIASHYRDRISTGDLLPGAVMPSKVELAAEWDVSKATVDRAMKLLREEGLIRGIPGVGTEVIGSPIALSSGSQRQDRGQHTGSSWGTGERSDSHTAALVPAPADVARAMGIEAGTEVIRRSRVYRDSHGVVAHSTSWIPGEFADVAPELLRGERLAAGTSLDVIAAKANRRPARCCHTTGARIATTDDLTLLELSPNTVAAILVLGSEFIDTNDMVIEYGVDLGAPGRTRTEVEDMPK